MLSENIIYIAVLINFFGAFSYIKSIYKGQTKPNLVSWFFWTLAPFLAVFFQIKAGASLSVLPVFMAGFGPFLVIIFSIFRKNSYWKLNALDLLCGVFSFLALALYIFTRDLNISILFAILSDGLAGIPTLIKSWKFPETETAMPYATGLFGNIVALLIIKNWIFTIYSFSVYNIAINLSILLCIYRKRFFRTSNAVQSL